MNHLTKISLSLLCICSFVPSGWGRTGKIVRALTKTPKSPILGRLDARLAEGYSASQRLRSLEAAANRLPARTNASSAARSREKFELHVVKPIEPTAPTSLRPRLTSPTADVVRDASLQYETFFSDFSAFRKEADAVLGNALLENVSVQETLHPMQISYYVEQLRLLEMRAARLQNVLFPTDAPLKEADEYIKFASQEFNKYYMPEVSGGNAVRPYVEEEFWMEYDWRKGRRDESLTQLPEDVHLAVLNDTKDILNMYKQWERAGRFPKGWKLSVYEDTMDMLNAVNAGARFDLIVSDIQVPGGGGRYMVSRLRELGIKTPVIGCSMYTRDKVNSTQLHAIGFDGYMYGSDMFEEPSGFIKWQGYIKNYYYYKRLGGWVR